MMKQVPSGNGMSFAPDKFAVVFGGLSLEHDLNIFAFRYLYEEYQKQSSSSDLELTTVYYITRDGEVLITPASPDEAVEYYLDNHRARVPLLDAFGEMQRRGEFVFVLVDNQARFPGIADTFAIPGSFGSVLSNALAISKFHLNQLVQGQDTDILIPPTSCITSPEEVAQVIREFDDAEIVVKPNSLGSSLFVERFRAASQDLEAITRHATLILRYDHQVLIQKRILGREYTCYLLERDHDIETIGVKELITPDNFFGTREKYQLNQGVEYKFFRSDKDQAPEIARIMEFSRDLARNIGLHHMSRIDFIVDSEAAVYFLEANTNPSIRPYQEALNNREENWSICDLIKTFMKNESSRVIKESDYNMLVQH